MIQEAQEIGKEVEMAREFVAMFETGPYKVQASRSYAHLDYPEVLKERPEDFRRLQAMKSQRHFESLEEANPYLRIMLTLVNNDDRLLTDEAFWNALSSTSSLEPERRKEAASIYRINYPMIIREVLIDHYAWAVPCKLALQTLAKYGPLIEMGAGAGYWASLLAKDPYKVDIVAYDKVVPHRSTITGQPHSHFPVQEGTEKKILEHPDRTLFLCWLPAGGDPMAANCLRNYQGKYLCYICDGITEEDGVLYEMIQEDWKEIDTIPIPVYHGIHDYLYICLRMTEEEKVDKKKMNEAGDA